MEFHLMARIGRTRGPPAARLTRKARTGAA